MDSDRIEKSVVLNTTLERAWRAVSDSAEFGRWFGAAFDGPFVEGQAVTGRIVPTQVDAEVARLQEPHRGTPMWVFIERVEPMRCLAFRWHPSPADAGQDPADRPTTLVTLTLSEVEGGVRLTIVESGFERLPDAIRGAAIEANRGGWDHQARLIAKYLGADIA